MIPLDTPTLQTDRFTIPHLYHTNLFNMSVPTIKTIGVVGTGVIGSSWTALFLARGHRVIVSDPAPGAEEKLQGYLSKEWATLSKIGLSPGASVHNYQFVQSIDEHLAHVDYIQEVRPLYPSMK